MYNMEATSSFIQKVLPRLKFLKSRSNIQVKVTKKKCSATERDGLPQGMHV